MCMCTYTKKLLNHMFEEFITLIKWIAKYVYNVNVNDIFMSQIWDAWMNVCLNKRSILK